MRMSKQCVVQPLKHEFSEGKTATDTDTTEATQLPTMIPGLKDLAVGSDWKGCLELVEKHLGFWSHEYQQLQFAIEYEDVLSKAAEKGFIDFIKLLLHNSFPVNTVVGPKGRTMLHVATINNKVDLINTLFSYGADVNLVDSQGLSAIHFTAMYGHYNAAKILLQNSDNSSIPCTDVDARDKSENSSLQYAAQNGDAQNVSLLQSEVVNINARTSNRETPLIIATKNGHIEVVKILLSIVYCDVDARDESGFSALHHAAKNGYANIVNCLMKEKVNINARTIDRETPLILAAIDGNTEVVKTLLSNPYCDVDATDNTNCFTALGWAKYYQHQSVLELLASKK